MRFDIVFKGEMFKKLNSELEREVCGGEHVLCPVSAKLCDVFACNENIHRTQSETFGDMIIDDMHYVFRWDISGCTVEYYFEQYWDVRTLEISRFDMAALAEMAKAFETFFNTPLSWSAAQTPHGCELVIEKTAL